MMGNNACLFAVLLLVVVSTAGESEPFHGLKKPPNYHDDDDQAQCTPIREPVCQGLQYTHTKMPNWVKMTSQEEAAKRMIDYKSLLNINCSHYLKLFLCTIYFPMCTQVLEKSALKPCKPLCLHVRRRCEPIMQQFQFSWPAELSCDDLPESPKLCIEPDGYALDTQKPVLPPASANMAGGSLASLQRMYPQLHDLFVKRRHGTPNIDSLIQAAAAADGGNIVLASEANRGCSAAEFPATYFSNDTCLTYCGADLYYRPADKKFARAWLLGWSILCVVSSALTFLTFIVDRSRLQYPERPVLYLAACYFAIGVGYILQYGLGPEVVTCRSVQSSDSNTVETQKYLLTGGQESTWCTVGFLISYYFGMAGNFWWVMLSLAWYLSTSRKWGHEGVESVSSVFHMFAWALPAIQSILVLILHKIDADELTGTCYTGFHSETALMFCVLLPQAASLILGLLLLSVGFAAVFRVRRKLKTPSDRERESRRRLEKSIAKLGVFVVLYTFPMACLLAGNLYEYLGQPRWRAALRRLDFARPHCLSPRGVAWGIPECHPDDSPSSEAAMLRIFMSFVVGITSGMWVWANKKTFVSWKRAICRESKRHGSRHRRGSFGKFDRPNLGATNAYHTPTFDAPANPPPPSVEASEVDRPGGVFVSDSNTIFSASAVGYSSSGCQSCRMCPPSAAAAAASTDLTAGGYSSVSPQPGLEMYGECYMHANACQHLNPHHDQRFHHRHHHQSFPFQNGAGAGGGAGIAPLLHRPPTSECV
ncbi:unnamed protein product [Mesocestoides corti]|uniref:Frizzled-4 n=1 Tax=Mesocestoides corti TaxID=53468 RepID=A0A0R3UAF3_MESCO|nr:unnamed protein product [Mesocestoides corti]